MLGLLPDVYIRVLRDMPLTCQITISEDTCHRLIVHEGGELFIGIRAAIFLFQLVELGNDRLGLFQVTRGSNTCLFERVSDDTDRVFIAEIVLGSLCDVIHRAKLQCVGGTVLFLKIGLTDLLCDISANTFFECMDTGVGPAL